MENIKFQKEPGYTYDLFFLFMLYFNKQEYLLISDELLLFFYLRDGNRAFLSEWYFDPYKAEFVQKNTICR